MYQNTSIHTGTNATIPHIAAYDFARACFCVYMSNKLYMIYTGFCIAAVMNECPGIQYRCIGCTYKLHRMHIYRQYPILFSVHLFVFIHVFTWPCVLFGMHVIGIRLAKIYVSQSKSILKHNSMHRLSDINIFFPFCIRCYSLTLRWYDFHFSLCFLSF